MAPIAALHGMPTAVAALVHALLADYMSFIVAAVRALRGGGRHPRHRQPARHAARSIPRSSRSAPRIASVVGTTGAAMILVRPLLRANAARLAQRACGGVLHLPGRQYRRRAVAARRSAAVRRLPARRRFLLDHAASLRCRPRSRPASCSRSSSSSTSGSTARTAASQLVGEPRAPVALGSRGLVNLAADRADRRRDPAVGDLEAGHRVRRLRHRARTAEPACATARSSSSRSSRCGSRPTSTASANGFSWEPIREVAKLFAGIFVCIIPVLAMLQAGRNGAFAWLLDAGDAARRQRRTTSPISGSPALLSALLDNAPTYLVFFELAGGDAARLMGELALDARRHLDGRGLHGRAHLYRQRAQLHDLCHRDRARRQDAELLRLHAVVRRRAAAGVRAAHFRFRRPALAFALAASAERAAPPRPWRALRPSAGTTAIASISISAPGRASCEIATAVLAGRGID